MTYFTNLQVIRQGHTQIMATAYLSFNSLASQMSKNAAFDVNKQNNPLQSWAVKNKTHSNY